MRSSLNRKGLLDCLARNHQKVTQGLSADVTLKRRDDVSRVERVENPKSAFTPGANDVRGTHVVTVIEAAQWAFPYVAEDDPHRAFTNDGHMIEISRHWKIKTLRLRLMNSK